MVISHQSAELVSASRVSRRRLSRGFLREIAAESERMTKLVEDLLFLARRDAKGAGMPMRAIDLRDVLNEAAHDLRGLAETAGFAFKRDGRGPMTQRSLATSRVPKRLFLTLPDNALGYSPAETEVTASILNRGEGVRTWRGWRIGIGISGGVIWPHIFQRFYRVDESRTDGGHGLGAVAGAEHCGGARRGD